MSSILCCGAQISLLFTQGSFSFFHSMQMWFVPLVLVLVTLVCPSSDSALCWLMSQPKPLNQSVWCLLYLAANRFVTGLDHANYGWIINVFFFFSLWINLFQMPVSVKFLFEHCCFKQNSSCFVGPVNGHEMFWTVLLTIMGFFVVFSSSLLVIIVSLVLLWCARKQLSKCLKISFNLFLLLIFTCWRGWSREHEVFFVCTLVYKTKMEM